LTIHTQIPITEPRNSHVIRASEIGSFLYCRRAWGYQREGESTANQAEMITGTDMHEQHGRIVLTAGLVRGLAYVFLLLALVLGTVYLLNQVFM
jgi:hypothetical protein